MNFLMWIPFFHIEIFCGVAAMDLFLNVEQEFFNVEFELLHLVARPKPGELITNQKPT
jgi:hypothetical protein